MTFNCSYYINNEMELDRFEEIVGKALKKLPAKFKSILKKNGVAVIARARMPQPLAEKYKNSVVFGVFIGVPYGRFYNMQYEPTRIELYKESFEAFFDDEEKLKQEIRRTVVHEVAHYFGFSEGEIRKLGY